MTMSDFTDPRPAPSDRVSVAIIGGSGLYDIDSVDIVEERDIDTPFGDPSGPIRIGEAGGTRVAFLPRHGPHHSYNPSTVPYRANVWALKSLGVFWVLTASAVGSLRQEIEPGDFVVPDQIIDKTFRRPNTLYEDFAVHVGLSNPYDPVLRDALLDVAEETLDGAVHDGATYTCMEGPAFSTKAESQMHRGWNADLIGMTAQPEAKLCREAEMAYATLGLPTDWDVWTEEAPHIEVDEILQILGTSTSAAADVFAELIPRLPDLDRSETDAQGALNHAIVTSPEGLPDDLDDTVGFIIEDYID
jgi:5'-methylthioadenosine phosphorylase